MDQPRLLFRDATGFAATWREVCFDKTLKRADVKHMRARFAAQHAWLSQLPPHRSFLTVSVIPEEAVTMIDGELRQVVDENVKLLAKRTRAAALVVDAGGLKGAVIRSIITGLTMITSSQYQTKTESTIEGALRWIAPQLDGEGGARPSYDDLLAAWHSVVAQSRAL